MGSSQAKAESLAECNAVDFTSQVTPVRSYSGFSLPQNGPPFYIIFLVVHGRHTGSVSPKIFEGGVSVAGSRLCGCFLRKKTCNPIILHFSVQSKAFKSLCRVIFVETCEYEVHPCLHVPMSFFCLFRTTASSGSQIQLSQRQARQTINMKKKIRRWRRNAQSNQTEQTPRQSRTRQPNR